MSKTTFYQTDFKPDYELFQQKISKLSSQKSRIIKKEVNLEKLQHQLQLINEQIEDQGLEYDKSPIFLRYASIQEINEKKKTASDCCMHCGQEMKKSIQCQICAEVYCKNCCWRKRVIPYTEHQDFRLCCEQCHQKYIRHFNNQQFYKEKGIYMAAIDELERKYQKTKTKYDKKQGQVNQYKQQKRVAKIKQGNLKKAALDEEKRIKQLQQEFERVVKQKAIRIKQEQERRKKQQEQDKERKVKQEAERQQQDQKRMIQIQQDQRKLLQAARLREQQLARRQEQIRRQKEQLEKQKKQLSESRLRQLQYLQKKKSQSPNNDSPIIKWREQKDIEQSPSKPEPRQVVPMDQIDFDSILKTQLSRQAVSMKEIDFESILENQLQSNSQNQSKPKRTLVNDQIDKKTQQLQRPNLKQLLKEINLNKKVQDKSEKPQIKDQKSLNHKDDQKSLNQKDNQKSLNHKDKSQKQEWPEVSTPPKLTMNQIKTMSINDLLSMKIPMNPSAAKQKRPRKSSHPQIKVDAQQNSTTTQNQKMYQSLLQPAIPQQNMMVGLAIPSNLGTNYGSNYGGQNTQKQQQLKNSIHSVHQQQDSIAKDKQSHKKALLRRESLISSVNKSSITNQKTPQYNDEDNAQGQSQKCTCQIM